MNKQAVIAAARIEVMLDSYQRRYGDRIARHTIHDIAFRTGLKTQAAKDGIARLMEHGTVIARLNGKVVEYRLHSDVRFAMGVQRMLAPAYA